MNKLIKTTFFLLMANLTANASPFSKELEQLRQWSQASQDKVAKDKKLIKSKEDQQDQAFLDSMSEQALVEISDSVSLRKAAVKRVPKPSPPLPKTKEKIKKKNYGKRRVRSR